MRVHDLVPGPGLDQEPQARRPRHRRQGRQDRRPRHQGPARPQHAWPRGFEGGQMPLKQRVPEAEGLQQPVPRRVRGGQPRHARASSATLDSVDPEVLVAARRRAQRAPSSRCSPAARSPEARRPRPRRVEGRRGGDHRRRRYGDAVPLPFKGEGKAGRPAARATSSPTADRLAGRSGACRPPARPTSSKDVAARALQPEEHLQGPGPAEQDPVHVHDRRALPPRRSRSGFPASTTLAVDQLEEAAKTAARSASSTCSPAGRSRASRSSPSASCRTSRRASSCRCSGS